MKFCKFCGTPIESNATFCPKCYRDLPQKPIEVDPNPEENTKTSSGSLFTRYKTPIIIGCIAVLILGVVLIFSGRGNCKYGSCRSKAVSGFSYCYSHKCAITSCDSSSYIYSKYCYAHYMLYDEDATESKNTVYSYELRISNVKVYSDYYTYAEGTVTNNSDTTVTYLKIKGSFKDSYGTVVDTDWTYAVGSEGLAPGESCKWKLSVEKDRSIETCDITILDYDY